MTYYATWRWFKWLRKEDRIGDPCRGISYCAFQHKRTDIIVESSMILSGWQASRQIDAAQAWNVWVQTYAQEFAGQFRQLLKTIRLGHGRSSRRTMIRVDVIYRIGKTIVVCDLLHSYYGRNTEDFSPRSWKKIRKIFTLERRTKMRVDVVYRIDKTIKVFDLNTCTKGAV